jgi:hypothetical protein
MAVLAHYKRVLGHRHIMQIHLVILSQDLGEAADYGY